MKKIKNNKNQIFKKITLGFGSISLLGGALAPIIACGDSKPKDKGISNPLENWDEKFMLEDGNNNLPETQQGSNFTWVYSKDGNNWSSTIGGLGAINLGDYVWVKQLPDKGYYLENGDNMGKIKISQFGPLQINTKQLIPTNILPAIAGGDMIQLNIANKSITRFIFATTQGFYEASGDANGAINPESITLIKAINGGVATPLPTYGYNGTTYAKVIQTSPTHVIFLTGDFLGRSSQGQADTFYQADLELNGSIIDSSITKVTKTGSTSFEYFIADNTWVLPMDVDSTGTAKAIWVGLSSNDQGVNAGKIASISLVNGKIDETTSTTLMDSDGTSSIFPGSRASLFGDQKQFAIVQRYSDLTIKGYKPETVGSEVTFGADSRGYNISELPSVLTGFFANSIGQNDTTVILGNTVDSPSSVGYGIFEVKVNNQGIPLEGYLDLSSLKRVDFDAKYEGLSPGNLNDSTIQIVQGKYALITTELGIYAVAINPIDGSLDPSKVQMVPVGTSNYSQLPSTNEGFVRAGEHMVYVETVNGLYQIHLKAWGSA